MRLICSLAALLLAPSLSAQSLWVRHHRPPAPDRGVTLPMTAWRAELTGRDDALTLVSEQVFCNRTRGRLEAEYVFPLPRGAVARDFELWIGDQPMPAEVLRGEKAREVYESIVRRARDPALLEYAGCDLLRARIFPVEPGAEARIRTHLSWLAPRVGELRSIQIPLLVPEGEPRFVFTADLRSRAKLGAIFSPSFELDVVRDGDHRARASYEGSIKGSRRLVLYSGVADGPTASVLCHKLGEDGTFLLTLFAPRPEAEKRIPRDVVFVCDRSGSMKGEKFDQAVAAVRHGVQTLCPEDRFEIVSYATDARSLFGGLRSATKENRKAAESHLENWRAAGGTAMSEALERALTAVADSVRMTIVVLLSDGEPTIGEIDPGRIARAVSEKRTEALRLFTFGVGVDVNARLLDDLAAGNGGHSDYVLPEEDLEVRVRAFFDRIGTPVLENLALEFEGIQVEELYPRELGDLFALSAVHVLGRYRGGGPASVVLRGKDAHGASTTHRVALDFPLRDEHDALLALYAREKIAFLLGEIRRNGAQQELVDEVVRLGREYGIVTPFTAALVVEDGMQLSRAFGLPAAGEVDAFAAVRLEELGYIQADEIEAELRDFRERATGESAVRRAAAARRLGANARPGELSPSTAGFAAGGRRGGVAGGGGTGPGAELPQTKTAGGRTFLRIGETWVERGLVDLADAHRRTVEAFSDEYFDLLRDRPELAPILALGQRVLFALDGTAVLVEPPTP